LALFQMQQETIRTELAAQGKTDEEIEQALQAHRQAYEQEKDADKKQVKKEASDFVQSLKNSVRETIVGQMPHLVAQNPALKKSLNLG
jgi:hypothetical protein